MKKLLIFLCVITHPFSFLKGLLSREPDFYIGGKDNPYLLRWWIIPRNRFFNIYLHKFLRDDDDRAIHDHPWGSCSIILRGGYIEHTPDGIFKRKVGGVYFRKATASHRIELYKFLGLDNGFSPNDRQAYEEYQLINRLYTRLQPAWSLFITGPKVREWGFHCPRGWVHWQRFCDETDHGNIGRGCD